MPPTLAGLACSRLDALDADARVAVLGRGGEPPVARRLRGRRPGTTVEVLDARDLVALHLGLAAGGPWDLVVDPTDAPRRGRRLATALAHLAPGGALVARVRDGDALDRVATAAAADLVATAEEHGELVVLERSAAPALPVLLETTQDDLLARRPDLGRVLHTVPPAAWTSGARVRTSRAHPRNPLPRSFEAPALSLREYAGVTCRGLQLAHTDAHVLPESFRHPLREEPSHALLTPLGPLAAAAPPGVAPDLPGTFLHLDPTVPDHFGHALTEQVAHLWAWREARRHHPDVRALVVARGGGDVPAWVRQLLAAGGIGGEDLVVAPGPVRVERLLAATPAYDIATYLHPAVLDTWAEVGAALDAQATVTDTPERVFHTRRHGKRRCLDAEQVEGWFEDAGFTVVRPEERPLADQVRVVRRAQVVAGFAGSGLFHLALAGGPKHAIVIGSENYPAHNEYFFAAALGHTLDLAVCPPEVPRGDRFTDAAFHSDFRVDPRQEGAFLRDVLAGLG